MYATGNDESDLPSTLPSYVPPSQSQAQSQAQASSASAPPFNLDMLGRVQLPLSSTKGEPSNDLGGKRHAPAGQWKTPPQTWYPSSNNEMTSKALQDPEGSQNSYNGDDDGPPARLPAQEIGGISAAQFAASTGGLTMDATLLARVSGTDPALMGSEEIKQIMRCPDLLSIYQKLQEEDDRRQRRLERNRASARVRREKKKNMVEMYEIEVSKLETSLNLLKTHRFGSGQAQELERALEYSGGEHLRHAMMSKEVKTELIGRILGQHMQSTIAIRNANREVQTLIAAATQDSEPFLTLRSQLRLTDEQCRQLQSLAHGAREEARKLDAITKCLSALRARDWLFFPGMEALLHQTRNAMTPQQFQKFLSWTTENENSIAQLPALPSAGSKGDQDVSFVFSED